MNASSGDRLLRLRPRIQLAALASAALLIGACGSGSQGTDQVDGGKDNRLTSESWAETCAPDCSEKQCGPDGCGGVCGECPSLQACEESLCVEYVCSSSKDCPGVLVCAKEVGLCVPCVGDEDCPEGEVCGADFDCHEIHTCQSDLDCKDAGLVCNKEAGVCVECVTGGDCADGETCQDNYCVGALCAAGDTKCQDSAVMSCAEDGSGWGVHMVCGQSQYCNEGACHDLVCSPNEIWCEGTVYTVCSEDGKSVKYEEDCEAAGLNCFETGCIEGVCLPLSKFCVDDQTKGLCNADGMDFGTIDCPAEFYCTQGECAPWACTPGAAFCEGNVAMQCSANGSHIVTQVDCGVDTCVAGQCADCVPECSGKECGPDGCGGVCGQCSSDIQAECVTGSECANGVCQQQVSPFFCYIADTCVPSGTEFPDDPCRKCLPTADQLDWSAVENDTPCGVDHACHNGVCCDYDCTAKECGTDGCGGVCGTCPEGIGCLDGQCEGCDDGNDIPWDGCTEGQITEFQVNTVVMNLQQRPSVAVGPQDTFLIAWEGGVNGGGGNGLDIYARLYSADGVAFETEALVNSDLALIQHDPEVISLPDGRWVVAWETHPGSCGGGEMCASIWAQILAPDGSKQGEQFKVNTQDGTGGLTYGLSGAAFSDSDFFLSWIRGSNPSNKKYLQYQFLDSQGAKVGAEMEVGGYFGESLDAVAMSDGKFVLQWRSTSNSACFMVYWLMLSANGLPMGTPVHTADCANQVSLAIADNDDFLVAWTYNHKGIAPYSVMGQLQTGTGEELAGPFTVEPGEGVLTNELDTAFLNDGRFVFAWPSQPNSNVPNDIWLQLLDAQGNPEGEKFKANVYTDNYQMNPDLASFQDGSFVVVWTSGVQDGNQTGVYAHRFNKDGIAIVH